MWYIYAMEYHSSMKKNEILLLVITQIGLEGIILSEVNQMEKEKHHMIAFVCKI